MMESNTLVFRSKEAVNDAVEEHLDFKDSNVNNLLTTDQTNFETKDGRRKKEFDSESC